MRTCLLRMAFIAGVFAAGAASSPLLTVSDIGFVVLSAVYNDTRTNFIDADLRGQTLATDGINVVVITTVGFAPFGNSELVASNPPITDQFIQLDFQTTALTFVGPLFSVPVTGSPVTALVNPALVALAGRNTAGFLFAGTNPGPNQTSIDSYVLVNIDSQVAAPEPAPEPATGALATALGLALVAVSVFRSRSRRPNTCRLRRG